MIYINCESCTLKKAEPVPYIVHEGIMARFERTVKRLWIVVILLIFLLAASNGAWIYYESQFEDIFVKQEVQTEDGDAFVNGVGDFNYGENQTDG